MNPAIDTRVRIGMKRSLPSSTTLLLPAPGATNEEGCLLEISDFKTANSLSILDLSEAAVPHPLSSLLSLLPSELEVACRNAKLAPNSMTGDVSSRFLAACVRETNAVPAECWDADAAAATPQMKVISQQMHDAMLFTPLDYERGENRFLEFFLRAIRSTYYEQYGYVPSSLLLLESMHTSSIHTMHTS